MRLPNSNASVWNILKPFVILSVFLYLLYVVTYRPEHSNQIHKLFAPEGVLHTDCLDGTRYVEKNLLTLDQNDPELIRYVRTRYMLPPPARDETYRFKHENNNPETEQARFARTFFKDKVGGIFMEAGANEGEFHSHTLDLEMKMNWTGLLIECNPLISPYLRTKKRKAWVAEVCISTTDHPQIVNFSNPEKWSYSGRFGAAWNLPIAGGTNWTYFDVETVPLYSIIAAAGITEIDFFAFDVEGIEFEVFKNFPFEKILIKVIIMEVYFLNGTERLQLEEFMTGKRYKLKEKWSIDHVYVHDSVVETTS